LNRRRDEVRTPACGECTDDIGGATTDQPECLCRARAKDDHQGANEQCVDLGDDDRRDSGCTAAASGEDGRRTDDDRSEHPEPQGKEHALAGHERIRPSMCAGNMGVTR